MALSIRFFNAKAKSLKSGEKLEVNVPQEIKDKILDGYKTILNRLSK